MYLSKSISVDCTPSSGQLANVVTKPLPSPRFLALHSKLTVVSLGGGYQSVNMFLYRLLYNILYSIMLFFFLLAFATCIIVVKIGYPNHV